MGAQASSFLTNLPSSVQPGSSYTENLLLREYGSVFVTRGGAIPPDRVVFANSEEVDAFQSKLRVSREILAGYAMELQSPAMEALCQAIEDANGRGLDISPRGPDAARRGYQQTVDLWASRIEPGLAHWTSLGRISEDLAARIRGLAPFDQVSIVLELEQQGVWFAKDLTKSIIYSVAPPGASQHLSLLAFDVKEFSDPEVREIMAANGWFRTVVSDEPHFTFLGLKSSELGQLGLRAVLSRGEPFWVPDI